MAATRQVDKKMVWRRCSEKPQDRRLEKLLFVESLTQFVALELVRMFEKWALCGRILVFGFAAKIEVRLHAEPILRLDDFQDFCGGLCRFVKAVRSDASTDSCEPLTPPALPGLVTAYACKLRGR